MSKAPGESGSVTGVTVGELRAWFSTEITRIKTDIDTLYDRINFQAQQGALSSSKVHELDPLVQALRDRVVDLEARVRQLADAGDEGIVTSLEFSEYKREIDNRIRDFADTVSNRVTDKIKADVKPITESLEADRKQLQELQTKVNGLIVKWAVAVSLISFVVGKIIEGFIKAKF